MIGQQVSNFRKVTYLSVLALVLPLVACSGGDGGSAGFGPGGAGSVVLSWTAPSERQNGSNLILDEIASYRLYYGVQSGVYPDRIEVNDHTVTQDEFSGIPSGSYFAVMTTVDTNGRESAWSTPEVTFSF